MESARLAGYNARREKRVGHFVTRHHEFSNDHSAFPRQYFVNRWRLEKKDPAAPLSEPVKPIVFWLDRNVPVEYRDTVKAGVLEWNKAFERIGFKDAIRVEMQPEDAAFDTADVRHASIRWYLDTSDGALAIGPSRVDPRTGEILDADILFEATMVQNFRNTWRTLVDPATAVAEVLVGLLERDVNTDVASLAKLQLVRPVAELKQLRARLAKA